MPEKAKTEKKPAAKKFGIDYVAKALKVSPATARIRLRGAKVKKSGKGYGWDNKADADKIVSQLSAA